MKQVTLYNELVRCYNRSRRKLQRLVTEGKNLRKQNILQRRIVRLFKTLTGLQRGLKLGMATAALSAGMLLFQPNAAQAQVEITFGAAQSNPFGLTNIDWPTPAFIDLDKDGDLDLMSGSAYGDFYYFENTGTVNAPSFAAPQFNPFGLTGIEVWSGIGGPVWASSPTFADLDNDGDMDMLSGCEEEYYAHFFYFENTGTATDPQFAPLQENPFGLPSYSIYVSTQPTFVDLDNDGDMDIVEGEYSRFGYGSVLFFKNTGTPSAPSFQGGGEIGYSNGYSCAPAFADLDKDGDLDLIIGSLTYGDFWYWQNTGTVAAPAFSFIQVNPFGLTSVGRQATPAFADLDNDGDMDLMSGGTSNFSYFENITPNIVLCPFPANLSTTNITSISAKLNWDPVTDALRYKVRYKVAGTSEWTKITDVKSNSKVISGLTPNTLYYWEVKSVCSANPVVSSDWSAKQSFTTGAFKMGDEPAISLQLYPNPVSESFTLDLQLSTTTDQSATIFLLNELGQVVYSSHEATGNGELKKVITMPSSASSGWYVVRVMMNDQVMEKKLMYQK